MVSVVVTMISKKDPTKTHDVVIEGVTDLSPFVDNKAKTNHIGVVFAISQTTGYIPYARESVVAIKTHVGRVLYENGEFAYTITAGAVQENTKKYL